MRSVMRASMAAARPAAAAAAVPRVAALHTRAALSAPTLSPLLTTPLEKIDPEIHDIIEQEKRRQWESLALIPSENFTSVSVLESLGSVMQNKYSEGYPGARYYGGNEFIDAAERLCQQRALEAFKLNPEEWGVNVQPHSGSPANFQVYTATLLPHERMMALDLPHGGQFVDNSDTHSLSHGYQTPTKKISAVSIYFECLPYRLDESTGLIDYDTLEKNSKLYRPKLLVTGASAYPRHIDYARMRSIANGVNALLMVDMAHISGLVAAGVMPSPFEYADIVTTTTHKSLRGPRGAMIFYRKGVRSTDKAGKVTRYELEDKINAAVFPGHQGGPHNHTITALAVALKQAQSEDYKAYQKLVLSNNKVLADSLVKKGYTLVSGGTDNHLILVDLRPLKLNGAKVERILELVCVALNKNTVPGDVSALSPGGVRLGTPALTSRGFDGAAFEQVADFFHRGVQIALKVQEKSGTKAAEFKAALDAAAKDGFNSLPELQQLRKDVQTYARTFPPIGFTLDSMKYKN